MGIKKGFTLLELIIVIIIVGILATLGLSQYTKIIEKGRRTEAKSILGDLRTAAITYKLEKGEWPLDITTLAINAPASCTSTHYFYYYLHDGHGCGSGEYHAEAYRCASGGKEPNASSGYWIECCYDSGRFNYQDNGFIEP